MRQKKLRGWGGTKAAAAGAVSAALISGGGTLAAVAVVALSVPATSAHAQTPFRLLRPENGATVREIVRVQMARRALDEAGVKYLSVSIDGKFREALAVFPTPETGKSVRTPSIEVTPKVVNILWNTKSLSDSGSNDKEGGQTQGVADGHHTLEVVAQDASGKRLGVQTLELNVDNTGGMQVPADGLTLAYRFQVGDNTRYHEIATVDYIGDRTAPAAPRALRGYNSPGFGQGGGGGRNAYGAPQGDENGPGGGAGRFGAPGGGYMPGQQSGPFTVQVQNVRANFERTTEDKLTGSAYFIRDKVLDGIILGGNGSAARLEDIYSLKSRYRTVTTAGDVLDYGVANAAHPGAYVALAIPNLGGGSRRVGQTWRVRTPVMLEWAALDKPPIVTATNTLEGLEWQSGYQTARIKQTFNGKANIPIYGGAGEMKGAAVQMDRTIWFSYKSGKIIRMETDVTVDGTGPSSVLSAMVPSAGINGGAGGGPGGFGGGPGGPGDEGGISFPASFPGPAGIPPGLSGGGGFGGIQQTPADAPKSPAKFHSHTVVTLVVPGV